MQQCCLTYDGDHIERTDTAAGGFGEAIRIISDAYASVYGIHKYY